MLGFKPSSLTQAQYLDVESSCVYEANDPLCPKCGSSDSRKLLGFSTTYVRGNGYLDKKGCKNDINLSLLTTGKDPFATSRTPGEVRDLTNKLRRNKEFNGKPSNVYLSK